MSAMYVHKMQTAVSVAKALTMVDLFGADFFTQINVRDLDNDYKILEKSIQYPHGEGDDKLKSRIERIAEKYSKGKIGTIIRIEFIKK